MYVRDKEAGPKGQALTRHGFRSALSPSFSSAKSRFIRNWVYIGLSDEHGAGLLAYAGIVQSIELPNSP